MLTVSPADWFRPPNFLLVDYYNQGSSPGSVFKVAALHNNVTYERPCCGKVSSAASLGKFRNFVSLLVVVIMGFQVATWL